nr:formyl transferase [Deltaproteobacteria bacterium]
MIKLLHDPAEGVLRIAGLLSGSGTNIRKILEHQKKLEAIEGTAPYRIVVLFSDTGTSNAAAIGKEFDIPVVIRDIAGFYACRGRKRSDLSLRPEFDEQTVKALAPFEATVAVYGGYMSIASKPIIKAFLGVNVHPADLAVEEGGRRKYTGDHAVRDALAAGEKTIAASTHIVELEVDQGPLLMISPPLAVVIKPEWNLSDPNDLNVAAAYNQERLKEQGDWVIFPRTIEYLSRGRFGRDESGLLSCDGKPIPKGLRLKSDELRA